MLKETGKSKLESDEISDAFVCTSYNSNAAAIDLHGDEDELLACGFKVQGCSKVSKKIIGPRTDRTIFYVVEDLILAKILETVRHSVTLEPCVARPLFAILLCLHLETGSKIYAI